MFLCLHAATSSRLIHRLVHTLGGIHRLGGLIPCTRRTVSGEVDLYVDGHTIFRIILHLHECRESLLAVACSTHTERNTQVWQRGILCVWVIVLEVVLADRSRTLTRIKGCRIQDVTNSNRSRLMPAIPDWGWLQSDVHVARGIHRLRSSRTVRELWLEL